MSRHWTACLRSALWIGSFMALAGLMNLSLLGQQSEDDPSDDSREKLVFLTTGRMLTGQVTRNVAGYLVEQPNGRVQVLTDDVKFIVNDLKEAYRKQRDSIAEPTPATHVALAQWCISYRLHEEARDELKKCLKTNPDHQEARRLLQRLTDTLRANMPARAEEPAPRKTVDGFIAPNAESLGGLSPDTAAQFTSRVQPLLLNKCGNASCHGASSSSDFRLTLSRGAGKGTRQNTERNLYETLRFLDLEMVSDSRLLRVAQGSHGGKGTIFVGPAGAEQMKALKAWAVAVAGEKRAENQKLEKRPRLVDLRNPKTRVTQASHTTPQATSEHDIATAVSERDPDRPTVTDEARRPVVKRADPTDAIELAEEPADAFDPEVFNRQFHRP